MSAIYSARGSKLAGRKLQQQIDHHDGFDSVLSRLNESGTPI